MNAAAAHATQTRAFLRGLLQPQVSTAARERRDLIILLLAVACVVLPHVEHIPLWATAVLALLWAWRMALTVLQRPLPGKLALLPLLVAATGAVWLEHHTLVGRDAGVTFLLLLMALKMLEMRARRDVFVVIFLSFFILLTQFMFGQGLPVAALTLATVLLLFFVLVSVNLTEADLPAGRKLRLVGLVFAKSIPLTVVLFILFPRLSGPLWTLPGDNPMGRTGLSNSMSPGAIGRLFGSDEIAFRVRFAGEPPQSAALYWRGPVLQQFSGRTWSPQGEQIGAPPPRIVAESDSAVDYTITLEPHQRDWLFALEMPQIVDTLDGLNPRMTAGGQLLAGQLINERTRYTLRSYRRFSLDPQLTRAQLVDALQLPASFNPRTLQFAADLRRRITPLGTEGRARDVEFVQAVLRHFREENFAYTLEPPLLGRDSVDEFLFDTRSGFCEHYASAFAVLMRALDIPARVVTGYHGGELNPVDGFVTVRQADAHAWNEVWLEGRGWVRVDPTGAVDPSRIESTVARRIGALAGAAAGEQQTGWLRAVRYNWEAMQNSWNQWVLSYSAQRQQALLARFGLAPTIEAIGIAFAVALSLMLLVLGALSLKHRVQRDPLAELAQRLRRRLRGVGIEAPDHLDLHRLRPQLATRLGPEERQQGLHLIDRLEALRYGRESLATGPSELRALRRAVRRFRPRAVQA